MEDKRIIYLIAIVLVALVLAGVVGVLLYMRLSPKPIEPTPVNQNVDSGATLPRPDGTSATSTANSSRQQLLEKEKQFISAYYRAIPLNYEPKSERYGLPIPSVKDDVDNYRDFSRKIPLDASLTALGNNGFVVIPDPFASGASDWESSYQTLAQKNVPVFITADSILGLYNETLQIVYKEIENEAFYPSLWGLLSKLADSTKLRYEFRRQQVGIENDLLAEADRLELAYITVALKLLAPEASQVRTTLTADSPYFSNDEAKRYTVQMPDYLTDQINKELQLIRTRSKSAVSPVVLYEKSYDRYAIPKQYQGTEKLKNYYLAITWLNDVVFPLWQKSDSCADCLLDQEDHRINFVTALTLSSDLAASQDLQNRWANIYKALSFFKSLEANLTYLDYNRAVHDTFGDTATIEAIFTADIETIDKRITALQQAIAKRQFLSILSDIPDTKDALGLRMLRNHYLMEQRILPALTGEPAGKYLGTVSKTSPAPFTACEQNKQFMRCLPTGIDLFKVTGSNTATNVLKETTNSSYEKYDNASANLAKDIVQFTTDTWHDNLYLNIFFGQKKLEHPSTQGLPSFMGTDAWKKRMLATGLGAWSDVHRDVVLTKDSTPDVAGLVSYFPYGYVQPEPELYNELLASTDMVLNGFTALQIINTNSKSFERLTNLKIVLEKLSEITKKELTNEALSSTDYGFINNFNKQISGIIGDIKKDGLVLKTQFTAFGDARLSLIEQLDGLEYIVAIYPGSDGKKFLAIGPAYRYIERSNANKTSTGWQAAFRP